MSKLLLDLESDDCRYPFGDGPIVFCGHRTVAGSSYCLPHKILCTKVPEHGLRGRASPQFSAVMRKNNIPKCMVVEDGEGLL